MKSIFVLLIFLSTGQLFSQISEGYIQYTIEVEAADTSLKTKQSVGLLRDSKMEIYFNPTHLRIDFKMGVISETKMIMDFEQDSVVSLSKTAYGKYAVKSTVEELSYVKQDESSSIQLLNDTKMILGYHCKKAIISSKGTKTTYWYTDEIKIDFKGNEFFDNKLPGFPLFFSKTENGVYMQYQASNIRETISNVGEIFNLTISPDYTLMPNK